MDIAEFSLDLFSLAGRNALVTGGNTGLGRAFSLALAKAGADVFAVGLAEDDGTTRRLIEGSGRRMVFMMADITQPGVPAAIAHRCVETLGSVDILVNSAGITKRVPTLECSEDVWRNIMNVNLNGTLRACQIFGKTMLRQHCGRIINIASLATFVAFHEVAAYGASKAAVAALTRSLAVEWAPCGVSVNAIAPGIFPTDLNRDLLDSPRGKELIARTPFARFGTVEEIVGIAVFLASNESRFTTGQIIAVDGGFLASGVNQ